MSLSSLNEGEYVLLLSTLKSIYDKRYSCSTCLSQDNKVILDKTQQIMACKIKSPTTRHTMEYGNLYLNYSRCIGNFTNTGAMQWISSHASYENGSMPFPGGYMDQPSKALEILHVIGGYKQSEEAKMREQSRMKSQSRIKRGR